MTMHQSKDHPSAVLLPEQIRLIRDNAAASEKAGQLHPDLLDLAHRQEWFRLFVPADGAAVRPLPDAVRLEEALSWADGSLGWTVTLCAGAGWFVGFLRDELRKEIFTDAMVCVAGSGASTGRAVRCDGGYEVTGSWKYASGALHATAFTANCIIEQDGSVLRNSDGSPLIRSFIFRKEEVAVIRSWDAMGMIATGSHSFEVKGLTVPDSRCFIIEPAHSTLGLPVYQFPFLSFAEVTLAVNISGMAIHFLDLCVPLFAEKIKSATISQAQSEMISGELRKAQNGLIERRRAFYESLDESWSICGGGDPLPAEMLKRIHDVSYDLAGFARQAVLRLYPFCGLSAAYHSAEINRVWRDINTAGQHSLLVRVG